MNQTPLTWPMSSLWCFPEGGVARSPPWTANTQSVLVLTMSNTSASVNLGFSFLIFCTGIQVKEVECHLVFQKSLTYFRQPMAKKS